MRIGDVEVPSQLRVPAPAGFGTQGHRLYPATPTVGYMIGKCRTWWTWPKSALYSVVGVIVDGGPVGCLDFLAGGAVTASLPVKPCPKTTATCARGPTRFVIDAGIAAAEAPPPRMCARSFAT